jgi:hypothetical protein
VTFSEFRRYLGDVAWFWPGVTISIVVAILLGSRVARALDTRRVVGTGLLFSFGLIVSATLTPSREALRFGAVAGGTCDLSRVGIAPISDLFGFGDPTFNVLLYVPLGFALGMVPSSVRRTVLIGSAIALPFVVETIQLVAVRLDRACQSSDVSDNLTGLFIGLVIGLLAGRLIRS